MTNFLNVMSECACVIYTKTLTRKKIKFIKEENINRKIYRTHRKLGETETYQALLLTV